VPVLSASNVVGLVSECGHVAAGADLSHLTAGEVMTTEVVTAQDADSVLASARLMCPAGVRHLPVLKDGQLAGMMSIRDLLGVLVSSQTDATAVETPPRAG